MALPCGFYEQRQRGSTWGFAKEAEKWSFVAAPGGGRNSGGVNGFRFIELAEIGSCRASVSPPQTHQDGLLLGSIGMAVAVCWGCPRCSDARAAGSAGAARCGECAAGSAGAARCGECGSCVCGRCALRGVREIYRTLLEQFFRLFSMYGTTSRDRVSGDTTKTSFFIFASVEVEDGLLGGHLLHRSGARSSAPKLCKLKRANPPRSRETGKSSNDSIMVVSWRLPPPSQHRLAGMPPETSPRKDRAMAMAMGRARPQRQPRVSGFGEATAGLGRLLWGVASYYATPGGLKGSGGWEEKEETPARPAGQQSRAPHRSPHAANHREGKR